MSWFGQNADEETVNTEELATNSKLDPMDTKIIEEDEDPTAYMTPSARERYIIRNTPVVNSKYLKHW